MNQYSASTICGYKVVVFSLICISLYIRMGDVFLISRSLWAEDGNVFIKQAVESGFSSLWIPYAGYLHVYPRIVAYVASFLSLHTIPYVFFSAWLLAFFLLISVVYKRLRSLGVSSIVILSTLIVIILQPTSGEVYFSLTNSQWFIGTALIIYVLAPKNRNDRKQNKRYQSYIMRGGGVALASLTGPFSLLLIPGLFIKFLFEKGIKKESLYIYVIVAIGSIIQFLVFINSQRISSAGVDLNVLHWIEALKIFFTFGSENIIVNILSLIYWFVFFYVILNSIYKTPDKYKASNFMAYLLLYMAFILYAAGLYASKHAPNLLNPLFNGSRYFFIPYTLLFVSTAMLYIKNIKLRILLMLSLAVICAKSFSPIYRADLQYHAYAAFSKVKNELNIPINPVWATHPGWYIRSIVDKPNIEPLFELIEVDLSSLDVLSAKKYLNKGVLVIKPTNNDSQINLPKVTQCKSSKYIGVEINLYREIEGWAQLFWGTNLGFSETRSIRRYYPKGNVTMSFAFEIESTPLILRVDPAETMSLVNVNSINLYCLD